MVENESKKQSKRMCNKYKRTGKCNTPNCPFDHRGEANAGEKIGKEPEKKDEKQKERSQQKSKEAELEALKKEVPAFTAKLRDKGA